MKIKGVPMYLRFRWISSRRTRQCLLQLGAALTVVTVSMLSAHGQQRYNIQSQRAHDLQHGGMPVGMIGQQRKIVRDAMIGYMQPVHFTVPDGCSIAIWNGSEYQALDAAKPVVRLQVGAAYRLRVSNIARRDGKQVYPSIEIINRLYPPPGQADRFPVMVHITQDELEKAVDGHFVHRVTYLENPETALPFQQVKGDQNWFRIRRDQDPLKIAAGLGRPMTIVRMGSRVPLASKDGKFELGAAPIEWIRGHQLKIANSTEPPVRHAKGTPSTTDIPVLSPTSFVRQSELKSSHPDSLVKNNPFALPRVKLPRQPETKKTDQKTSPPERLQGRTVTTETVAESRFVPPIQSADELRQSLQTKPQKRVQDPGQR